MTENEICKYALSRKCPHSPYDSKTCRSGGGGYCGKYREFEDRERRHDRIILVSMLMFYHVVFISIGVLLTWLILSGFDNVLTMLGVMGFAAWLIVAFGILEEWFK